MQEDLILEEKRIRQQLEALLCRLVNTYGISYQEQGDYYRHEFGIEPGSDDEQIHKVYDFFGGRGCAYLLDEHLLPHKSEDDLEYTLILQLYTVTDAHGHETLHYYAHYNTGTAYEAETCEVLHSHIHTLTTAELCHLLEALKREEKLR